MTQRSGSGRDYGRGWPRVPRRQPPAGKTVGIPNSNLRTSRHGDEEAKMGFGAPRSSYLGQADLKYADGGDGGGGGSMSGPQPHEAAFLEELLFSCSITSSSSSSWLEAVLSIMDQCAGDWSAVLHEAHTLHGPASVSCVLVQGYMYSYPLYNPIFLHMYNTNTYSRPCW